MVFGGHPQWPVNLLLRVLNLKTGEISPLPGSEGMWSPRWSPDGGSIAGLSAVGNKLLSYDLRTKRQTVLIDQDTSYPSWSKDGKFLFAAVKDGWWRFDVRQKKAEHIKPPQDLSIALGGWFTVAPDGSLITAQILDPLTSMRSIGIYLR